MAMVKSKLKFRKPTGLKGKCVSCNYRTNSRPGGLCVRCYEAQRAVEIVDEIEDRRPKKAPVPTAAQPGSEEKIMIMEARVAAGEELFHLFDAGVDRPAWLRAPLRRLEVERQGREEPHRTGRKKRRKTESLRASIFRV